MKINLILIGKTNSKTYESIIDDYSERVKHYTPFDVTVIPELKNTKSLSQDQQKTLEGEQIMRQVQDSDYVVLLDEHGQEVPTASPQPSISEQTKSYRSRR